VQRDTSMPHIPSRESDIAPKTVCLRRLGGDRAGELRVGRFFACMRRAFTRSTPARPGDYAGCDEHRHCIQRLRAHEVCRLPEQALHQFPALMEGPRLAGRLPSVLSDMFPASLPETPRHADRCKAAKK
jgi:hypothetical protein